MQFPNGINLKKTALKKCPQTGIWQFFNIKSKNNPFKVLNYKLNRYFVKTSPSVRYELTKKYNF
jgi:hypothetical protein